jgi:acyl transferase domain-containing protein
MYISLYKGNTFKEIERVLVQHIPASKALEIRGDGAIHAVIVYSSQKDFKTKSHKLLEALSIGEELFDIENGIYLSKQKITNDEIAIIFPGQGSQYVGMLKPFIQYEVFQRETKKLLEDSEKLGISLSPLLNSGDQNQLNQTQYSQPALAVVSYALLKLLKSYNLKCKNFAGHSFGELMALCAAEAYNSQTLMKLSIERGRLMSMAGVTAPGKMVAVIEKGSKNYEDLHQKIEELNILDPSIELANINTHTQLVYTGLASKILAFKEVLSKNNLKCALLSSSAAFHGKLMEPAAEEFECFIENISEEIHSPRYYVVSSSPNAKYTSKEHVIHYLAEQLQEQVNWVKAIKNLRSSGVKVFLEVGPKNVLTKMVQELIPENEARVIALDNGLPLEHTLGYLLSLGVELTLKDKLIPKTEGNYKIIQGFVEKQKALVEKAQAITDDAQRESVQSQIMRDTEEVLGHFNRSYS